MLWLTNSSSTGLLLKQYVTQEKQEPSTFEHLEEGDGCVGEEKEFLGLFFALKSGGRKGLLMIKRFEHVFAVWFINFQWLFGLVFHTLLVLLSHDLSAEMPNNTARAIIGFDLAFLSTFSHI